MVDDPGSGCRPRDSDAATPPASTGCCPARPPAQRDANGNIKFVWAPCRRAANNTVPPGAAASTRMASLSAADHTRRVTTVTTRGWFVPCPDMVRIQRQQRSSVSGCGAYRRKAPITEHLPRSWPLSIVSPPCLTAGQILMASGRQFFVAPDIVSATMRGQKAMSAGARSRHNACRCLARSYDRNWVTAAIRRRGLRGRRRLRSRP